MKLFYTVKTPKTDIYIDNRDVRTGGCIKQPPVTKTLRVFFVVLFLGVTELLENIFQNYIPEQEEIKTD